MTGQKSGALLEAAPRPAPPPPVRGSASEAGRGPELSVLIIDRDQDLLAIATSILESSGYRVTALRQVSDGEKRLRTHVDDVVLLDLDISRAYGSRLLKTGLLGHGGGRVILTLTSDIRAESLLDALGAGAWGHLRKPFSATGLLELVGRAGSKRSTPKT